MITMMHTAATVQNYNFTSNDNLFLDTNIWLYLFGPRRAVPSDMEIYSDMFNRIVNARCQIYIDIVVVSEFINAYARMQWRFIAPRVRSFKTFRDSPDFKPVAQNIADHVKLIMEYCKRIESGFTTLPINSLLDDYISGDFDFNDQVITEI
ncbi:PIN domain-containing protein, partial [Candidatus Poribacteria bacterium]|nr:PIN domain-containing protein [Candidatus Poribacteria bacterium]